MSGYKLKLGEFIKFKSRVFVTLDYLNNGKVIYRFTFYKSSGRNVKPGIKAGDWLPVVGISNADWINKLTSSKPLTDISARYNLIQFDELVRRIEERLKTVEPELEELNWDDEEWINFVKKVNQFSLLAGVESHDKNHVSLLKLKIHEFRSWWFEALIQTGKLK